MDGTSEVYELIEDPIRKKQYQIERCCGKVCEIKQKHFIFYISLLISFA